MKSTPSLSTVYVTTAAFNPNLRLRREIKDVVPWLSKMTAGQTMKCTGMIGAHGQMIIRPNKYLPLAWKKVAASLAKRPAQFGEEYCAWFDIARLLAVCSNVIVTMQDDGGAAINYPRAIIESKIGPGENAKCVVVAISNMLEIWSVEGWVSWLQKTGAQLPSIERGALAELFRDECR